MKKLLGIVVLGLLWCNIGFADDVQWDLVLGNSSGELIKIPVHVHILEVNEKGYKTKTKPEHVEKHFKKVNEIWAQVNFFWDLKKIDYIHAGNKNFALSDIKWLKKHAKNTKKISTDGYKKRRRQFFHNLLQIKQNQTKGAINVYYIPYLFSACGRTYFYPEPAPNKEFTIVGHESKFCSDQAITLAQQLGHLLYLPHEDKDGLLMQPRGKGTKIPMGLGLWARENYIKYLEKYFDQYEDITVAEKAAEKKRIAKEKTAEETTQTQEVAEKEVTWEVISKITGGIFPESYDFPFFISKESFVLKQGTKDQYKFLKTVYDKSLKRCKVDLDGWDGWGDAKCIIGVIKYIEPSNPSAKQIINNKDGIELKNIKVSWNGIDNKDTLIAEKTTQTDDSSNVVQQLKDLNELYESGVLTEEEFNKAKKKLLN